MKKELQAEPNQERTVVVLRIATRSVDREGRSVGPRRGQRSHLLVLVGRVPGVVVRCVQRGLDSPLAPSVERFTVLEVASLEVDGTVEEIVGAAIFVGAVAHGCFSSSAGQDWDARRGLPEARASFAS